MLRDQKQKDVIGKMKRSKKLIDIDNNNFYAQGSFSDPEPSCIGSRELFLHIVDRSDYGAKLYLNKRSVKKLRDDLSKVLDLWDKK